MIPSPPPQKKINTWKEKVENIFCDETSVLGGKQAARFAEPLGRFPCCGVNSGELATGGRGGWWCPTREPHLKWPGPGFVGDRLGDVSSSRPRGEVGAQWFPDRFISL